MPPASRVSSQPARLDEYVTRSIAQRISLPTHRKFLDAASHLAGVRSADQRVPSADATLHDLDRLIVTAGDCESFVTQCAKSFREADMGSLVNAWNRTADADYAAAKSAGKWVPAKRVGWMLLRFATNGGGRLIESIGDLSTATHIVILVPGMTNELSNVDRDFRPRAELLHNELVARAKPGESVAVVLWLGYENPQLSDAYNAIGSQMAAEGAVTLTKDVAELRDRTSATITVVAHSYGTIVAGGALALGIEADRLIVLGSPGMNAAKRSDLGSPNVELYATSVGQKPSPVVNLIRVSGHLLVKGVSDLALVPLAPLADTGVDIATGRDWASATTNLHVHGSDPANPSFGAHTFHSNGQGHGAYFDDGSLGLTNVALISLGREPVRSVRDAGSKTKKPVQPKASK
jgi:pimeloyl-ACP methyl ester carboxylesterase